MSKVRVYEVAKQLGIDEQAALTLLQQQGAAVRNRLSAVEQDVAERAKRALERAKTASVVEERIRPTVVRRKATPKPEPVVPAQTTSAVRHGRRDEPEARQIRPVTPSVPTTPLSRVADRPERQSAPVQSKPVVQVETHAKEPSTAKASEPRAIAPIVVEAQSHSEATAPAESKHELPAAVKTEAAVLSDSRPEQRPEVAHTAPAEQPKATQSKVESKASPKIREPKTETPTEVTPVVAAPVTPVTPKAPEVSPVESKVAAPAESPVVPARATELESKIEPVAARAEHVEESVPTSSTQPESASNSPPPATPSTAPRSIAPKTGIETWAGRPGVPMPQPVQSRGSMRPGAPAGPGVMQRRGVQYDPRRDVTPPGRPGMNAPVNRPQPTSNMRPGMRGPMGGTGGATGNRGRMAAPTLRRATAPVPSAEMSAHKKVIKIEQKVTLNTLAGRMSLKATDVLMKLLAMGMSGVNINSSLDADTAKLLASEFGWEVEDVAVSDEAAIRGLRGEEVLVVADPDTELRPPVVTVMGHVDHGKTSLLDYIRKTKVASGEAGGITQHIGAYKVTTPRGQVAFLDTPGHEAFTQMRARGAGVTDIVVLVVAADDGVMPQTREAVNHAKAARVPIVVAVNKIDKPEADTNRVRRELMELDLIPEDLGGDTMFVNVSAKTGQGVDELLEALALQAEVAELRANPRKPATGTVIEAMLDRGKGPVARILVRDGTLSVGDIVLAGAAYGKVRAMTDEHGRAVLKAGPSTPVEILGLGDVPNAGDSVDVVKDARKALEFAEQRGARKKHSSAIPTAKVSLEDIARRVAESGQLELRLIVKADVQGSVEAVADTLQKLSTEKVKVTLVHCAVGAITEGDINLAAASKAIVVGFSVRPAGKAASLADTEGVQIRLYNIIYNAVDDVKLAMAGLLAPTLVEKFLGRAEVRQVFNISKTGIVAGSFVTDGTIKRSAGKARLLRDGATVWEGKIGGLKHIKEDKREIEKGFECGISLDGYSDVKAGDLIECYDIEEIAGTL